MGAAASSLSPSACHPDGANWPQDAEGSHHDIGPPGPINYSPDGASVPDGRDAGALNPSPPGTNPGVPGCTWNQIPYQSGSATERRRFASVQRRLRLYMGRRSTWLRSRVARELAVAAFFVALTLVLTWPIAD